MLEDDRILAELTPFKTAPQPAMPVIGPCQQDVRKGHKPYERLNRSSVQPLVISRICQSEHCKENKGNVVTGIFQFGKKHLRRNGDGGVIQPDGHGPYGDPHHADRKIQSVPDMPSLPTDHAGYKIYSRRDEQEQGNVCKFEHGRPEIVYTI